MTHEFIATQENFYGKLILTTCQRKQTPYCTGL